MIAKRRCADVGIGFDRCFFFTAFAIYPKDRLLTHMEFLRIQRGTPEQVHMNLEAVSKPFGIFVLCHSDLRKRTP